MHSTVRSAFVTGQAQARHAVIIKWCTSWLAAWLTLLCCRFSAFSCAHPSLFSCQLRRFTASCKLVCRGSVVHPISNGYCRSVLILAGSGDLNHTLTIAGIVWRHRKRPHTGSCDTHTYTRITHSFMANLPPSRGKASYFWQWLIHETFSHAAALRMSHRCDFKVSV